MLGTDLHTCGLSETEKPAMSMEIKSQPPILSSQSSRPFTPAMSTSVISSAHRDMLTCHVLSRERRGRGEEGGERGKEGGELYQEISGIDS